MTIKICLLIIALFAFSSLSTVLGVSPAFVLPPETLSYHGLIQENGAEVNVVPDIKVAQGPVCAIQLKSVADAEDDQRQLPFLVELEDKRTGKARIRLRDGVQLDCVRHKSYTFELVAVRCGDKVASRSVLIDIDVVSNENKHAPTFAQRWYEITIDEGHLFRDIVKLEAKDNDCSGNASRICRYEITNDAAPFSVDSRTGVLSATAPLDSKTSRSHLISVVAFDCGGKRSDEVGITVHVRPQCNAGWKGLPASVSFVPGAKPTVPVFPAASLDLCDIECDFDSLETSLKLSSEYIGRGCDREALSLKAQRQFCGVNEQTVELFPSLNDVNHANMLQWSSRSTEIDEIYAFDGQSTAMTVPPETAKPLMPDRFTLNFWMKHGGKQQQAKDSDEEYESTRKENIVCSSDENKHNRHHFALYVRNCKLEMLFRREEAKTNKSIDFEPAEWRWSLEHVCDSQWHQYVLSVDFPNVELLVDGQLINDKQYNVEILDDEPLHAVKGLKTKLVVGACWHGAQNRFAQFFKGHLSSLTFLPNRVEEPATVQCLHRCQESLQFERMDALSPGMDATFSSDMSSLKLRAQSVRSMSELLQKVVYVNHRHEPTPGYRILSMDTLLKCKHLTSPIHLTPVKTFLKVERLPDPDIVLSHKSDNLASEVLVPTSRSELRTGHAAIFDDLRIAVQRPNLDGSFVDISEVARLEYCRIVFDSPLHQHKVGMPSERLTLPAALIASSKLDFQSTPTNFVLVGFETPSAYLSILRQLHYNSTRIESFTKRVFKLSCSMKRGAITSNQLAFRLTATEDEGIDESAPQLAETRSEIGGHHLQKHVEVEGQPMHNALSKQELPARRVFQKESLPAVAPSGAQTGAVATVVVVCIGFLVILAILGIIRIRSIARRDGYHAARKLSKGDGDLSWDDSGMNIIVNPLLVEPADMSVKDETVQDSSFCGGNKQSHASDDSECDESLQDDEDDDDDDANSDEENNNREEQKVILSMPQSKSKRSGLEWEDELICRQERARKHQTYRV